MTVSLRGQRIVVFRGEAGQVYAVGARCPHLGSNLGGGRVVGESIECPYHRFRFGGDGQCLQTRELQARAFPTAERFGAVFVFSGSEPKFAFPAFEGEPGLASARPMHFRLETAWYMVGANAFDARHFGTAHTRRLTRKARASFGDPVAATVSYEYAIEGTGLIDRAIRGVSGARVAFDVTSWCGNVLMVSAKFERDASFGVVIVEPSAGEAANTRVTVIVNAKRGTALSGRLRAEIKRVTIRQMLLDDFASLNGLEHVHDGLQPGDEVLAGYLRWIGDAAQKTNRG